MDKKSGKLNRTFFLKGILLSQNYSYERLTRISKIRVRNLSIDPNLFFSHPKVNFNYTLMQMACQTCLATSKFFSENILELDFDLRFLP
jgi:hypothetical protein